MGQDLILSTMIAGRKHSPQKECLRRVSQVKAYFCFKLENMIVGPFAKRRHMVPVSWKAVMEWGRPAGWAGPDLEGQL